MRVRTRVEDKTSVDAPDRLTSGGESSQQRQGARRAEETGRRDFPAAAGCASGGGDGAVVEVPVASSGSPSQCTSPSGYAPKGLVSSLSLLVLVCVHWDCT
ncbi:hypothetical protein Taro_048692 [Colocasia esculenta]|uniref:Uncharacterized protein n=1 Tax=Colocasia esculenta TaxID=4460 RepID=A0A843X8S9_COLES|nr:hypothetical protein [Colocasia esculenta]